MNTSIVRVIGVVIIILIVIGGIYEYHSMHTNSKPSMAVVATTSYLCRDGKSIDASYTATNVTLTLSDTRALILPQVLSGSGTRYENAGTVFLSKGNSASLEENGKETFSDCVANGSPTASADSNGMKTFVDSAGTFSFMYPSTVTVSGGGGDYTQSWMVQATTSGMILAKGTLDKSYQPNTNFSEGTVTVGTSADPSAVSTCLTYNPSGGPSAGAKKVSVNGVQYMMVTSSDAGAGNQYQTTSYRTVRNGQCYVVEYTIHSTNIGNYSPDQNIKTFDAAAVTKVLDGIIQSFRFTDGA